MQPQCTDPRPHHDPTTSAAADTMIFSDNHQHHPPLDNNIALPDPNSSNNNNDGASIESTSQRRPRGRPPGSKNKPKSQNTNPNQIFKPDLNPTNQHILEILDGADVIDSIAKYSIRHNTTLRILHASGAVANVTLRQSSSVVNLNGRFDILSLSAVFLTPTIHSQIPIGAFNDVAITLSFPEFQVVGGFVMGPLMASGSVFVLLESISSLMYQQLGLEERENGNTTSLEEINGVGVGAECGFNVALYSDDFMPY